MYLLICKSGYKSHKGNPVVWASGFLVLPGVLKPFESLSFLKLVIRGYSRVLKGVWRYGFQDFLSYLES